MLITVKINGVSYDLASTITPYIDIYKKYDETTLDGKRHKKVNGTKTNYRIKFFNDTSGRYYELQRILSTAETVELTVPINATEEQTAVYYPEIVSFKAKGVLNGEFYHNLLDVRFDKVEYDE